MAKSGKHNLRRWELPKGSGIPIAEFINRKVGRDFGLSFRVTLHARLAGARQFKQFDAAEKAKAWAKEQFETFRREGVQGFQLTPRQKEDAAKALALLEGSNLTLSDAASIALKHHRTQQAPVTVADAIARLVQEKEAGNLRERSVRDLRNLAGVSGRSAEGFSARSKKNYLITVRTFFHWAKERGLTAAENPATSIPTPKIDWGAPSILTPEEAQQLLRAAQTEQQGRLLASVVLGLFAGIRSNEIMQLDWSAIDLDEGILTIGAQIAKKRRLRVLELIPNCLAWLKTIPERKEPVAPGRYTVRCAGFVKKAGFPDWGANRANAMRHSFGSYHFAPYSDAAKTSAMLGHRANDQVLFDSYRSLGRRKRKCILEFGREERRSPLIWPRPLSNLGCAFPT